MRESQYIDTYLDTAENPDTRWTPQTYLSYSLAGKAKDYSRGYYIALMRAIHHRLSNRTVIEVPSKRGSTAFIRAGNSYSEQEKLT